jgi:uncharacterized protein YkwD
MQFLRPALAAQTTRAAERRLVADALAVSSSGMRLGPGSLAALIATAACTDGVGMPIREAAPLSGERDAGQAVQPDAGGDAPRTCAAVADWPEDLADSEEALVRRINEVRTGRFECGGRTYDHEFPWLQSSAELRCAARLHSIDMAISGDFGREGSDGSLPHNRIQGAGFELGDHGELIAYYPDYGERSAGDVFRNLFRNTNNACETFVDREYTHIGVGRYDGYWTVDFAEARDSDRMAHP